MKTSATRFALVFLVFAFSFQFVSNSLLGPEIALFPANGEWYPGMDSQTTWKYALAIVLYPVKLIMIAPLSFLGQDPDPPPPLLVVAFAVYWTGLALLAYYILGNVIRRKKTTINRIK